MRASQAGVLEDEVGDFGDGLLDVAGVALLGLATGGATGEAVQDENSDLGVGGLDVDEGQLGCRLLLGVLVGVVPMLGEGHGDDGGVQQHRQPGPVVRRGRGAQDRLDAAAQEAGAVEVGGDAGAGGALEESCAPRS
ncbi:hypothetical protein [Streptomyces hydrogenans]|uniref:hypothetical protein n=1 Tax=Streptomyces hydrogenans TaxID=1873719 RepID=UPI0035DCF2D3